jgi:uncharacterized membrane protein
LSLNSCKVFLANRTVEKTSQKRCSVGDIGRPKIDGWKDEHKEHTMTLLFAFLIGFFAGLRSLTAPAVTAWAVHLGWLSLEGRPLSFMGSIPSVAIFTLLALVELVADKLPKTPSRTAAPGLIARIVMGALTGACVAASGAQSVLPGALLGAAGGVVGCFGGYRARTQLVKALNTRDIYVALLEDLVAIAGCLWVVSRF